MSSRTITPRLRAILGVAIMSVLLVLYFVLVGIRAIALLGSGTAIAIAMGAALLFFPLLGAWALTRELLFGLRATRLTDSLAHDGLLPDDLGEPADGTVSRESACAAFPRYRAETEADPENWRTWMRLGLVYDASGDRQKARAAIREAIAREREFRA